MEAGVEYERPVDIPFRVQQLARYFSHLAQQKTAMMHASAYLENTENCG